MASYGEWTPAGGGQYYGYSAQNTVAATNSYGDWVPGGGGQTYGTSASNADDGSADNPAGDQPQGTAAADAGPPAWYLEWLAARERERQSAYNTLYTMFKDWGIDMDGSGLAKQVKSWIWEDKSADEVSLLIRKTDAYNARFTGMADLIKRGQFMSEADYIGLERDMRNTMNSWNIPKEFYDDYKDFGRLIANGVSVKEVDDRIKSAKTFLDTEAPSAYREALKAMGISDSALLAHVLDGDRAQSIITNEMKRAAFTGAANQFGFNIDTAEGAKYGATLGDQFNAIGVDQRMALEKTLAELGTVAANDERLASIDREQFQREDTLDAELLSDQTKKLASQRRGLREAARFSGSSAVSTGSLSRNSGV